MCGATYMLENPRVLEGFSTIQASCAEELEGSACITQQAAATRWHDTSLSHEFRDMYAVLVNL